MALGLSALLLAGAAGAIPSQGAPTQPTWATLRWLSCVTTFAAQAADPTPAAAAAMQYRLDRITGLDPSFSEAWIYGASMIRVLEGPSGTRARDFVRQGQRVRSDLPWTSLAPEAR